MTLLKDTDVSSVNKTNIEKTKAWCARAKKVIPGGVNSPVRNFQRVLPYPILASRAMGGYIYDIHDTPYIDLINSWGAIIHGHCFDRINQAVQNQLNRSLSVGVTTTLEIEVAQLVSEITSYDQVRMVNSGTEATMTAIRLARGFTKRNKIIKFIGHYHGHQDMLLVQAGSGLADLASLQKREASSLGVPPGAIQDTICLPFNDIEAVKQAFELNPEEIAAVILEPVTGNMGVLAADLQFMQELKKYCERNGTLLIFDEVMTGFRLSLRGAQKIYGKLADISCYAKVLGGGFPVGAIAADQEIMSSLAPEGGVYQAGTLSGNPVVMAASKATLQALIEDETFYERLELKGAIMDLIGHYIQKQNLPLQWVRVGSMMNLYFTASPVRSFEDLQAIDTESFKAYFLYMLDHGVLIPPSPYEAWFFQQSIAQQDAEKIATLSVDFLTQYYR